jgi:hypothetical protein
MLDNEPKNEWSVPEGTTFICTPEDVEYTTQNSTANFIFIPTQLAI